MAPTVETTAGEDSPVEVGHSPAPTVSVVMVTFGTDDIVLDALAAIAAHTTVPYDVIVVDNLPEDGRPATRDLLRRRTSGVRLIAAPSNLGFAGANEVAVQRSTAQYVCFMNPDVEVAGEWLAPLVRALDDPAVGIAAPVLLNPDGTIQEAGGLLFDDGWTTPIGGEIALPGDEGQLFARDVDYASACCWVVRREEHVARGGFDDVFHPAYFEDVDYALRVEAEGQVTRLVVDQPVVHRSGSGGSGGDPTLSHGSHHTFVAKWADRLVLQPTWMPDQVAAVNQRDRTCARRFAVVAAGAMVIEERQRVLAAATSLAEARPRDRVTLLTDDAAGLDVVGARRRGLEVVEGDVDVLVAERRAQVTDWTLDAGDLDTGGDRDVAADAPDGPAGKRQHARVCVGAVSASVVLILLALVAAGIAGRLSGHGRRQQTLAQRCRRPFR